MSGRPPARFRLPRNVWIVTLTSFLTDISSELLVYLIPLFLLETLGAGTAVIGLIEGIAETTASLLKVGAGWLSDRLGRRKWLTVGGYALSTLAKPFLLLAAGWPVVLAVRFFDRVGKGIRTAPRDALIADSIEARQRGLAFGLHRAGDTAGALVGILIALAIVLVVQPGGGILQRATFHWAVLFSIVPALLAVLVLAWGAREVPRQRPPRPFSLSWGGFPPRYRRFIALVVLFTLGNSSDAFLILRARERGMSVATILTMLAAFTLVYALVAGPAGAWSDRVGRRRLLVIGWLLYGAVYLGFALAGAGWQLWVLFALYGVFYGLTEGAAKALVADLVPPEKRGTAFGIFNAAIGLAALPASVIAGILWSGLGGWAGFGPAAPFFLGAALAALAAFGLLRLPPTATMPE